MSSPGISHAMVMAAGLGKRMRPLTDHLPKPMVQVAGVALIDRTLDWLATSDVTHAVVNTHYLAEQIESHVQARTSPHVQVSREEVLLETGGGVKKALSLLGDKAFFVLNSDAICLDSGKSQALSRLSAFWDEQSMDIVLLLHPREKAIGYEGPGDFFLTADGVLTRRGEAALAPYVFTGVQLLHPRIFQDTPQGPFSLNLLYDRALAHGRLGALVHEGEWLHVGDHEGLQQADAFFRR